MPNDIDQLLAVAEANRIKFDAPQELALPSVQGRPVHDDPTDPRQLGAIVNRCKAHFVWSPVLEQWAKITRVECRRLITTLPVGITVAARIEGDSLLIG